MNMSMKTNFSFELFYTDRTAITTEQRNEVMRKLEPSLNNAFQVNDSAAVVTVSDSHKGSYNKIAELVSTQSDAQIAETLKQFCQQTGLTVSMLE
jgi:hypothetical protein